MIAKKMKDKKFLPDEDLIGLLKKMVKQRNDSCEAYEKANRTDLLKSERQEIEVINEFLPKQLSEDDTLLEYWSPSEEIRKYAQDVKSIHIASIRNVRISNNGSAIVVEAERELRLETHEQGLKHQWIRALQFLQQAAHLCCPATSMSGKMPTQYKRSINGGQGNNNNNNNNGRNNRSNNNNKNSRSFMNNNSRNNGSFFNSNSKNNNNNNKNRMKNNNTRSNDYYESTGSTKYDQYKQRKRMQREKERKENSRPW